MKKGIIGKVLIGAGFLGLAYALFKGSTPKTETQAAAAPPAPTQSNVNSLGGLKKKSKRKKRSKK